MFFLSSSAKVSEESLVDLHGRVVIVTGANTGIGFATVQLLARKGAKVYLAARNKGRVDAAIEELRKDIPDANLNWLKLDLSDPQSINQAVNEFLSNETRLDILVNNAAIGVWKHTLGANGISDVMMINHVGHFALTEKLLPILKATANNDGSDVRIVNLSSMTHSSVSPKSFLGKEHFGRAGRGDFNSNMEAYAYSKLANLLHIKELQRRLVQDDLPITCIAVHPGSVKTEGLDSSTVDGAKNVGFAAASKEVKENRDKYKGVYLTPTARITQPSKPAQDERLAKDLYETSLDILKELGV